MKNVRLPLILGTLLLLTQAALAKDYWIQVATYGEKVSKDYFEEAGVSNVVQKLDQTKIYRYYIKGFNNESSAEAVKEAVVDKGFRYAKVVDMEEFRAKCAAACPPKQKFKKIYFNYDKADLKAKSRKTLNEVSRIVKSDPDLVVEVQGHTDSRGAERYNLNLSENRAKQAQTFLVRRGIPRNRVMTKYYGESDPVALNVDNDGKDSKVGRRFNRRVEILIYRRGDRQPITDRMRYEGIPRGLRNY